MRIEETMNRECSGRTEASGDLNQRPAIGQTTSRVGSIQQFTG